MNTADAAMGTAATRVCLVRGAHCAPHPACCAQGHMLSAEEELELVGRLSLHSDDRWLHLLLQAKCKKVCMHACVYVCVLG